MKKTYFNALHSLIVLALIIISCNKAYHCQECITIPPGGIINNSPRASAGIDQTITLPVDSVLLDGRGSTDPDNNITSYLWNVVAGGTITILQNNNAVALVKNLTPGLYLFELKVTDANGLSSRDTVKVIVNISNCGASGRPVLNLQLTPIGTLSVPREPVVAAAGNKVVFAGGLSYICGPDTDVPSSAVDIYDVLTGTWTTASLSVGRMGISAVSCGNKLFFAGGDGGWGTQVSYNNVDIYDVSSNTWSLARLSIPRTKLSSASVGTKVFFAGDNSNKVDIYDLSSNTWSIANLSVARSYISVVSINDKVYFAGGIDAGNNPLDVIDIYDNSSNSWSTSSLVSLKGEISGIGAGDKVYWFKDNQVEIRDTRNLSNSFECLATNYSQLGAVKNNDIVFIGGIMNTIDNINVYNSVSGNWSVGAFSQSKYGAGIIGFNNTIYIGGGWDNTGCQTNKVYTLNW